MKSKSDLKNVSISDKSAKPVLIQGELSILNEIRFQEEVTLEIRGSKGPLRLDISKEEFNSLLSYATRA
jgi:anti-anti-sigma regulatory factor